MDASERAELIAALHQAATFGEGLLELNERLLDDALASGGNRQDAKEIEYIRARLEHLRAQLAELRQRLARLTVEPPGRGH